MARVASTRSLGVVVALAMGLIGLAAPASASQSSRTTTATTEPGACARHKAAVRDLFYVVNGHRIANLDGVTTEGAWVTAVFTMASSCRTQLSLVAAASGARRLYSASTAPFAAGIGALQVQTPPCAYRLALVTGVAGSGTIPAADRRLASVTGGASRCGAR
jgi:hypothetical protein